MEVFLHSWAQALMQWIGSSLACTAWGKKRHTSFETYCSGKPNHLALRVATEYIGRSLLNVCFCWGIVVQQGIQNLQYTRICENSILKNRLEWLNVCSILYVCIKSGKTKLGLANLKTCFTVASFRCVWISWFTNN